MSSELIPAAPKGIQESVDTYSSGLVTYLENLGLPSEGVLMPLEERRKVLTNLPSVISQVPGNLLPRSTYVSKSIAACGAGLFDAALNFLWDETIKNLRDKVVRFDLDYFFDSVVINTERRKKLRSADDLRELEDWELVRGCHLTGILSDIGFKHLDYIRNMRNWASAAHPNQNELTGFQLISWLETCIKEVIGKEPSGPVIEVKRLLHNVRNTTFRKSDIRPIISNIELLPHDLLMSLLRTLFGMFVDPDMSTEAKNNIRLIAKSSWEHSPEECKEELGIKYSTFAANGDTARRDAAKEFLQTVDGLTYLPPDMLAAEVSEKVNNLYQAHVGFNNFHTEPSHATMLRHYIPESGKIPNQVCFSYVKTLCMCFIGNGYGVSNLAVSDYRVLIARFQDSEIQALCRLPSDIEIASRLQFESCAKRFRELIEYLKPRTSNAKLLQCIDHLLSRTDAQLPSVGNTTEYKKLLGVRSR